MASEILLRNVIYPWDVADETFSALVDRQLFTDIFLGDRHWPYRDLDHLPEWVLL
jgi:hypothetical protein